jgi:hypothetical protein
MEVWMQATLWEARARAYHLWCAISTLDKQEKILLEVDRLMIVQHPWTRCLIICSHQGGLIKFNRVLIRLLDAVLLLCLIQQACLDKIWLTYQSAQVSMIKSQMLISKVSLRVEGHLWIKTMKARNQLQILQHLQNK